MFRVTSLGSLSDRQLDRLIKRAAVLLVVGLFAFAAFYVADRYRWPDTPLVDRQVAAAEAAVAAQPDDIGERLRLAGLLTAASRFPDAVRHYDEVLRIAPGNKIALLGRGNALYQTGDLVTATAAYQSLIDLTATGEFTPVDPQVEEAYYYLGAIALKQADAGKAIASFQAALRITRSDADAAFGLGSAYLLAGRPADAIEPLRQAVLFVPQGWPDPYAKLAEAYTAMGRGADAAYAEAMVAFAEGRPDEARTALEKLQGPDSSVDLLLGLAMVAEAQGDSSASLAWYRAVLAKDAQNFFALQGETRLAAGAGSSAP